MDIFVSYSHKDTDWKDRVCLYLHCLRMQRRLDFQAWDDSEINVSENWEQKIDEAISCAKVALLLISPDFLVSSFIMQKEVPKLRKLEADGRLAIVPLIIRPSPWQAVDWLSAI